MLIHEITKIYLDLQELNLQASRREPHTVFFPGNGLLFDPIRKDDFAFTKNITKNILSGSVNYSKKIKLDLQ